MRISDWSSDVCSSDLRAYACVGSEAGAFVPWRQQPARAQSCIVALALQQRGHDLVAQQRVVALRLTVAAARFLAVGQPDVQASAQAAAAGVAQEGLETRRREGGRRADDTT